MVGVRAMPVTATFSGLSAALSVIVTLALRLPLAVGEKVTLIVQEALTASVLEPLGQVLVVWKSAALVPVVVMLLMLSGAVPTLLSVMVCAALVVPTFW